MNDQNLDQLIAAAEVLRPLLGELVFVGGCVTGLLITDDAAGDPRSTLDVDAIAEITSYAQYTKFGDRLRAFLDALPGYLLPDAASQSRIGIVALAPETDSLTVAARFDFFRAMTVREWSSNQFVNSL